MNDSESLATLLTKLSSFSFPIMVVVTLLFGILNFLIIWNGS